MAKLTIRKGVIKNLKDLVSWLETKSHRSGSYIDSGTGARRSRRLSPGLFYEVRRSNVDVFAVVRELSENACTEGIVFKNRSNPEKDPNSADIQKFDQLLTSRHNTFRDWKARLIGDVEVSGNAYVHISRGSGTDKPIGLSFIDPRTMSVVTDKHGTVLSWIQVVGGVKKTFQPEEIAHFILQNDENSAVFGLSAMEPAFFEVITDKKAVISNLAFFENGAIPAAQYILDDGLTQQEQEIAVTALNKELRGEGNKHRSVALQGVKEIKVLSVSAKDMEFHVLRMLTTEKVCAAFGVPKSILNYTDSVNRATAEQQNKKFREGTIEPLEIAVAEFINENLLPKLGINDIKIKFKTKTFENQQWKEASSRADQAQGILTINEVRIERNLPIFEESEHGEFVNKPMFLQGTSVVPVEDIGVDLLDLPATDTEDKAVKEIADIQEASERYLYGKKTD